MNALTTKILVKPPTPLTAYLPDVPPGFEAIVLQCLDKDPARRWPDLATFAAALVPYAPPRAVPYAARIASVLGVTVEPSRPTDVLTLERARLRASEPAAILPEVKNLQAIATTGGATSQPAGRPPKTRSGRLAAGVGAGLVVLVLGAVGVVRWRSDRAGSVPSSASGTSAEGVPVPLAASSTERTPPPPAGTPSVVPASGPTATAAASAMVGPAAKPVQKGAAPPSAPVIKVPASTSRPASPSGTLYDR